MIMAAWKLGPILARAIAWCSSLRRNRRSRHCASRSSPSKRACRRAYSTWCRASATRLARRSRCTRMSTASASLVPPHGQAHPWAMRRSRTSSGVSLECGGKSPNIVMADYSDVERAARAAAYRSSSTRARCVLQVRAWWVHESIKDAGLEQVARVGRELAPGDPLDAATKLGAIVDAQQMQRVLGYIDHRPPGWCARRTRWRARCAAKVAAATSKPTVFDDVKTSMRIAREDVFGPVLATITFKDEAEAIAIANDTSYGLAAAVWTRDLKTAHRMSRAIRAGMVYVNCYDSDDITVPFGGFKQSGIGRDKSLPRLRQVHRIEDDLDRPHLDRAPVRRHGPARILRSAGGRDRRAWRHCPA